MPPSFRPGAVALAPTPPHPQGGSPTPLYQYILPYFLTPAMAVWDSSWVTVLELFGIFVSPGVDLNKLFISRSGRSTHRSRLRFAQLGCRPRFARLPSGHPGRFGDLSAVRQPCIQGRAGLRPPVGSPTPNQLPDLDDVHSCFP